MSMIEALVSAENVMAWHEWAWAIALVLLGLGVSYALLQYVAAGRGPVGSRFLTGRSLRSALVIGLLLVGTVPAAALGLILAERSAHLRHDRMANRLEESVVSVAGAVDQFIDKHRAAVTSAAQAMSETSKHDRESLTAWLLLYHDIYADFLTMLTADREGDIVTATSNMTGFLVPVAELGGQNVSDRHYFRHPMSDGLPYVSDVFQGRDLGRDPIVAVSAPLIDEAGQRSGIVEGSLNLRVFSRIDDGRSNVDYSDMILVDQDHRVIYASTGAALTELQSIASDPLIESASTAGEANAYDFSVSTEEGPHGYLGAYARTGNGWTVYLRVPLEQISRQMMSDYRVSGALLGVACLLSLLLAATIVRRVSRSVRDMNRAVASFRLDGAGEDIETPAGTPTEFIPIFRQMRRRSRHLRKAHERLNHSIAAGESLRRELTQTIALKDVEIAERTAELEEANRTLSGLSRSDPLTGIPNRREFDTFTERVWRVGARERAPAAIILLDVDFFKIYNDTSGHLAGDECLRAVARALRNCAARPLDLVARYGGEEFVAVLGGATVADALVVAERMRQTVFDLQVPHPGSSFGVVTVSVGVAAAEPACSQAVDKTLEGADEALYYAKAAGRNCVVYSDGGEYVTYDADDEHKDPGSTTVLSILAGQLRDGSGQP